MQGENQSRASSEYEPSGYSTDDGHLSHSDWSRPSSRNEMQPSRPSSRNQINLSGTDSQSAAGQSGNLRAGSSRLGSQSLPPLPFIHQTSPDKACTAAKAVDLAEGKEGLEKDEFGDLEQTGGLSLEDRQPGHSELLKQILWHCVIWSRPVLSSP